MGTSAGQALVLGSGVSGLTVAARLQQAGWRVRIWAAEPAEATTSSVAAAIWYPYRAYPYDRVLRWGERSYAVFEQLAADPSTGVRMRRGLELSRRPVDEPWWRAAVRDVGRADPDELPDGYRYGLRFEVPVVEMPVYLRWLRHRVTSRGGRVERRRAASLGEAAAAAPVVVNCTGLGARELVGDDDVVPVRGQVVRVRNPGLDRFLLDELHPEGVTYVVPRSGDCVLGGTAEEGVWSLQPDRATTSAILRRCAALEPRLVGSEVLGAAVGLRPARRAVRLERQEVAGAVVVHDYGHGGAGVTLSWGCAEEVAWLVGA
jgi:D-amino-acid oxidase